MQKLRLTRRSRGPMRSKGFVWLCLMSGSRLTHGATMRQTGSYIVGGMKTREIIQFLTG